MENWIIENNRKEIIFKLEKKDFDEEYLLTLMKRIEIEILSKKSGVDESFLEVADQINQGWWEKNEDEFLKKSYDKF